MLQLLTTVCHKCLPGSIKIFYTLTKFLMHFPKQLRKIFPTAVLTAKFLCFSFSPLTICCIYLTLLDACSFRIVKSPW